MSSTHLEPPGEHDDHDLDMHDAFVPVAPLRAKRPVFQRFGPLVRRFELWVGLAFLFIVLWSIGLFNGHKDTTQTTTTTTTTTGNGFTGGMPPLGSNVTTNPRTSADVPLTHPKSTAHPQNSPAPTQLSSQITSQDATDREAAAAKSMSGSADALSAPVDHPSTMVFEHPPVEHQSTQVPNPSAITIPRIGGEANSSVQQPQAPSASIGAQGDGSDQILVSGGEKASSPADAAAPNGPITAQEAQNMNRANFGPSGGTSEYLSSVAQDALAQSEVFAGTPIQMHLDDKIVSTLPGQVSCHVTKDVKSSLPPYAVVIPAGSACIGRYDASINPGQDRLLVVWDYIIMPNGRTFNLQGMNGAETDGSTGFHSEVNDHRGRTYTTVFLASVLDAAASLANPATAGFNLNPTQIAASAAAQRINDLASKKIDQQMNVPPTLTVAPHDFIIRLRSTAILQPYYQKDIDASAKAVQP